MSANTPMKKPQDKTSINKKSGQSICIIPTVSREANVVQGKLFGECVDCLCDTGATISVVSENLFGKLSKVKNFVIKPCKPEFVAQAVNGKPLFVKGVVNLPLQLGATKFCHEFYIISVGSPIILGLDFLSKYQADIKCGAGVIQIQGRTFPLKSVRPQQESDPLKVNVLAAETIELDPFTQTIFKVKVEPYIEHRLEGQTAVICPELPKRWKVLGGQVLVIVKQGEAYMLALNPTTEKVRIFKNTPVGKITPVSEDEINALTTESKPVDSTKLKVDLTKTELTEDQKQSLLEVLSEYADIFAEDTSQLGRTSLVKHHIDTGDHQPIRSRPYRVSPFKKEIMTEHIKDMEKNNIIKPSFSPWSAPVVLIGKRSDDGSTKASFRNTEDLDPKKVFKQFRFCIDYRNLNLISKKDSYRIPRIDDTLDALCQKEGQGSEWYSTLDMLSGYHQMELDEDSKEKTAFVTPHMGVWEFNVLPFGLTNGPASYQRLMETLLRGLCPKICLIYIDDLICHSRTFAEHLIHLTKIFEILRAANLKVKLSKCAFARPSVKFLGHIVSKEGIVPDPNNVKAVKEFRTPTKVKQVQSFLGLANYYRKFIQNFAQIAKPLTDLLRKDQRFIWTDECGRAFNLLKSKLTSPPVLAYPSFEHSFTLYTDASGEALGAVLAQSIDSAPERVIAYAGRDLRSNELKYSTTERECLALMDAIKRFSHYLEGRKFKVVTDHNSLQWLMNYKDNNPRLQRWALRLQAYDLKSFIDLDECITMQIPCLEVSIGHML